MIFREHRYLYGFTDKTHVCANCNHFYLHYDATGVPFHFGHCAYPRLKNRKIDDTCEHFTFAKEKR